MDADTVIFIHEFLTEFFKNQDDPISPPGVKDRKTIESAVARPFASAGGKEVYPSIFLKAAALFHSITCNHSFHNGNKRAALLSTLYFLSENNYLLEGCSDDEMYEFSRQVAAHELCENRKDEVHAIANWLSSNSRKQQKGERPLKFGVLRDILSKFGFEIIDNGKTCDIYKDGTVIETILKKGIQGFEDYDPYYISELRKRLCLNVENGIDSLKFYGQKGISEELNQFMMLRLDVMKRLAKI